jgi:hypothetical protein
MTTPFLLDVAFARSPDKPTAGGIEMLNAEGR